MALGPPWNFATSPPEARRPTPRSSYLARPYADTRLLRIVIDMNARNGEEVEGSPWFR